MLLSADLLELNADDSASATGFVLESTQDPKRGASATLIVKDGTLSLHGFVVAGDAYAPIRFIEDFRGSRVESAGPSAPVRISGFTKLPSAGSLFSVVKSKKEAEALAKSRAAEGASVEREALEEGVSELALIVKADVAGSIDAIVHELNKITNERAVIRIVSSGVGNVTEGDVKTAVASNGVVIAFNVGTDQIASELAERDKVQILHFSIIYELATKVEELLKKRIPSVATERELGRALVLKVFSTSGKKQVLGARHTSGVLTVGNRIKLLRKDEEVARGSILNLQQARADAKEIKTEGDFGAELECREKATYGDEIVAFEISAT